MQKKNYHKTLNRRKGWLAFNGAGLLCVGIIFAFVLCPMNKGAEANATTSGSLQVSVKSASNLSVSLGSAVEISGEVDQFTSGATTLKVQTNNPTGYALYMTTEDGTTSLKNNVDASSDKEISSIMNDAVGSDPIGNTWGYSIDQNAITEQSTFKPIMADGATAIYTTNLASTLGQTDSYNLGFGVHTDRTLPAGVYSNVIKVSVVANPW